MLYLSFEIGNFTVQLQLFVTQFSIGVPQFSYLFLPLAIGLAEDLFFLFLLRNLSILLIE